jgi:hypothetical protein
MRAGSACEPHKMKYNRANALLATFTEGVLRAHLL